MVLIFLPILAGSGREDVVLVIINPVSIQELVFLVYEGACSTHPMRTPRDPDEQQL